MWHQNLAKPVLYLSADYTTQLAQGKFQKFQINLIKCPNNTNLQVLSNLFFIINLIYLDNKNTQSL